MNKNSMNDLIGNLMSSQYLHKNWRRYAIVLAIIIMLAGLLFSRFLLSTGMIIFILLSIIHKNLKTQIRDFFSSPVLWSMSFLFLIPLISGIWSDDFSKWQQIIIIKLPLLLMSICFAGETKLLNKDWEKIAFAFVILIIIGGVWSMFQYIMDASSVHAGYLRSGTIMTPLENDHVRFSLLVTLAIITSSFLLIKGKKYFSKSVIAFLLFSIIALTIYLHILAVRTGLFCFYASVLIFFIWLLWKQKRSSIFLFLLLILLLPVVAYFVFPTFKNRISYIRYDLSFVKKNIYQRGSNDGTRIISIKAGWNIQNQNPLTGIGFGDIENETNKWYQDHFPQMIEDDKKLPSSEWMMYGAGSGWPGFILFSAIILLPLFISPLRKNIVWLIINVSIAISYLFDIGLEVQFGVFVHTFTLLWWYKWLPAQSNEIWLK
jgi:hypothetical protein